MRYALLVLAGLLWYSSTEYSIIRYPVHKNKNNRCTKTKRFELVFGARDLYSLGFAKQPLSGVHGSQLESRANKCRASQSFHYRRVSTLDNHSAAVDKYYHNKVQ